MRNVGIMILKPNQFPEIKSNEDKLTVLEDLQENLTLSAQQIFSWLSL